MKYYIFILTILLPAAVFGQLLHTIKVINGATHKPVKDIYCHILKDDDKWVDLEKTNKKGIFVAELREPDSTATYQIDISQSGYKPLRKTICPLTRKKTTVTIFPDSTYAEKKPNLVYMECSLIHFGDYFPKEPHSMDDLPDSISAKLASHLTDRLGQVFYSKLKICDGQIVDLDRLYIVEDHAKNYQWTPYSYYLCFSFQDTSKGVGLYTAKIVLDKFGNVVEEIQLPNIKNNPEKRDIISLEQAKAIATANKFYDDKTEISLSYDREADAITWCFRQITLHPNHMISGWTWVIDAHNGKVIGKHYYGGTWD